MCCCFLFRYISENELFSVKRVYDDKNYNIIFIPRLENENEKKVLFYYKVKEL